MKIGFLYFILGVSSLAVLLMSNAGGAGAVQSVDRTGGPLSPGPCQTCHSSGAFSPSIDVSVQDDNSALVTSFIPGEVYTVKVKVNSTGSPAGFGYMATALDATNSGVGSFSVPMDQQVTTLSGVDYVEQFGISTSDEFSYTWVAPTNSTGNITFYVSAAAVNGTGSSGGDGGTFTNIVLTEEPLGFDSKEEQFDLAVIPNPVSDLMQVAIEIPQTGTYQLNVMDTNGRILLANQIELLSKTTNSVELEVSDLPSGQYFLSLENDRGISTSSFVKK